MLARHALLFLYRGENNARPLPVRAGVSGPFWDTAPSSISAETAAYTLTCSLNYRAACLSALFRDSLRKQLADERASACLGCVFSNEGQEWLSRLRLLGEMQ